jgi:crossover junction endodeoxyribonuclease RuvC
MRILGVDPGSLITGYGLIDLDGAQLKLKEAGIIKLKAKDELAHRIHGVYRQLEDVVKTYQPDVLVLEKLYTHYDYRTTASILGHVRGVICLLCAQKNMALVETSVKRIRKTLTGNGSSTKRQTQSMVAHLLNISERDLTPDASDALALAIGYVSLIRKKI